MTYPKISFVIPTLNAQKVIETCLSSIKSQNYPKSSIEVIIADGGSTDSTKIISNKYGCKIVDNPLKTAEAGKATAVKHCTGKYIALVDSDNILPHKNWLKKMIYPLEKDTSILGSEPISFAYRKNSGYIERYSALIGANDPYAFITGVYDRFSYLTGKWTGIKIKQQNFLGYKKITLLPNKPIPTIGANGTIFRAEFLKKLTDQYLFDIDLITNHLISTQKPIFFAKVKQDIIHTYCESSYSKFIRKQNRRLKDYFYYQQYRKYNWTSQNRFAPILFSFYCLSIFPMILDTFTGFIIKPDFAWFFHPIACLTTLYIYTSNSTYYFFTKNTTKLNRDNWKQ